MPALHIEPWPTPGLTLLFLALLLQLGHFPGWRPTPLRPRTPDDCPCCRENDGTPANSKTVITYALRKSPRGCKIRSWALPGVLPIRIALGSLVIRSLMKRLSRYQGGFEAEAKSQVPYSVSGLASGSHA